VNDMHVSVTIFYCLFFRFLPTVNTINKVCCNTVKDNQVFNESLDDEWIIAKSL
jgi:hypothetical protein